MAVERDRKLAGWLRHEGKSRVPHREGAQAAVGGRNPDEADQVWGAEAAGPADGCPGGVHL